MKLGAYYKSEQHQQADMRIYADVLSECLQHGRPLADCVRELRIAYRENMRTYDLTQWRQVERLKMKQAVGRDR